MDMPGIVPDTQQGAIDFFSSRTPTWAANQAAIGISAAQVVDIDAKVTAAQTKLAAAQAARNAAKTATLDLADAMNDMRSFGGDLIKTIRAFAETTDDDSVYILSDIPPVSPPKPTGVPDVPTEVSSSINGFGYVFIEWKASRAVGTQFILQRQLTPVDGAPTAWAFAGASTTNDYTDTTVPTGFASVSYRVYAQRASGTSDASNVTTLAFGSNASGTGGANDLTIAA
jgi:hypothetical protein